MPDISGNLSDDERLEIFEKCMSEQKFDSLAFTGFMSSIFTGSFAGLAAPFIEGYKNEGCIAILTDAQKAKLRSNTDDAHGRKGMPTGRMPPA